MKLISVLFLFTVSCSSSKKEAHDFTGFYPWVQEKNAIVISCVHCGCIIDDLNRVYTESPSTLSSYNIYGDTLCLQKALFAKIVKHKSQSELDSISTDLFNMLVIKKNNSGKIDTRLVISDESGDMFKILR